MDAQAVFKKVLRMDNKYDTNTEEYDKVLLKLLWSKGVSEIIFKYKCDDSPSFRKMNTQIERTIDSISEMIMALILFIEMRSVSKNDLIHSQMARNIVSECTKQAKLFADNICKDVHDCNMNIFQGITNIECRQINQWRKQFMYDMFEEVLKDDYVKCKILSIMVHSKKHAMIQTLCQHDQIFKIINDYIDPQIMQQKWNKFKNINYIETDMYDLLGSMENLQRFAKNTTVSNMILVYKYINSLYHSLWIQTVLLKFFSCVVNK